MNLAGFSSYDWKISAASSSTLASTSNSFCKVSTLFKVKISGLEPGMAFFTRKETSVSSTPDFVLSAYSPITRQVLMIFSIMIPNFANLTPDCSDEAPTPVLLRILLPSIALGVTRLPAALEGLPARDALGDASIPKSYLSQSIGDNEFDLI